MKFLIALIVVIGACTVQSSPAVFSHHSGKIEQVNIFTNDAKLPDWIQDTIDNLIEHAKDILKQIQDILGNGLSSAIEAIKQAIQSGIDSITGLVDDLKDKLGQLGEGVECAIEQSEKLDKLVEQVTTDVTECANHAMDQYKEIEEDVNKLTGELMEKIEELTNVVTKCAGGSTIGMITCILKETGTLASDIEKIFENAKALYNLISVIATDATECATDVVNKATAQISEIADDVQKCIDENTPSRLVLHH